MRCAAPEEGSGFDWGCGNGLVSAKIQAKKGNVHGFDIADFRADAAKNATDAFTFRKFDGLHTGVVEKSYAAGFITNVLHHTDHADKIIAEMARILQPGGKLVVIETIPEDETLEAQEITFLVDYLGNRLFWYGADIPVPGTFRRVNEWWATFVTSGFKTKKSIPLGIDQRMFPIPHHLFVFERKQD